MTMMHALAATLIALIIGCALALYFGLRPAQANNLELPRPAVEASAPVSLADATLVVAQ